MSEETTTGTKDPREACIETVCGEMLGKMFGGEGRTVDCESILSQFPKGAEIPEEWKAAMSACCAGSAES